jgi:hypothetical protein
VVAIRTSRGSKSAHPCGLAKNIPPDAWPRQGHPMSGFHRMSRCERNRGQGAQAKMTSESMMRLIANLLLQLALFVQAWFSSSCRQSWSSVASAASRAMPGCGRRKINWFRPFGWRYYPGRRGSVTLWGLGHHEGRGRLKPVLSRPWADAKMDIRHLPSGPAFH